jgi:hypothetical protein
MEPDLTKIKLLDPTRKGLLKLPASALKIWMCHWMHENLNDESWPSIETIVEETDLSWNTVVTWRSWLLRNSWLEKVGEVQPRMEKGRWAVPVLTVKDGSNSTGTQMTDTQSLGNRKNDRTQNLGIEGSIGLGSGSSSLPFDSCSGRAASPPPLAGESKEGNKPRTLEPRSTATPTPTPTHGHRQNGNGEDQKFCPKCKEPWFRDKNHRCKPKPLAHEFDEDDFDDSYEPRSLDPDFGGERIEVMEDGSHGPIGRKQSGMDQAASQKTAESIVGEGRPTPRTAPVYDAPVPPPPNDGLSCPLCGKPKEECFDDFCSVCFRKQMAHQT